MGRFWLVFWGCLAVACGDSSLDNGNHQLNSNLQETEQCVEGPFYGSYKGFNPVPNPLPDFGCSSDFSYVYYKPCDSNPHPLHIFLTGTGGDWDAGWVHQHLLKEMAKKGFISASVQYSFDILFSCNTMEKKAQCIFSENDKSSFLNKIIQEEPKLKLDSGIVAHGHSQGSFILNSGSNQFPAINGMLLTGTGIKFGASISKVLPQIASHGFDLSQCLSYTKTTINPKAVLAVNGEHDEFFYKDNVCDKKSEAIKSNLQSVTGLNCGDRHNCRLQNGAGWQIVSGNDITDGVADHRFFLKGVNKACPMSIKHQGESSIDPNWLDNSFSWSRDNLLNWLSEYSCDGIDNDQDGQIDEGGISSGRCSPSILP